MSAPRASGLDDVDRRWDTPSPPLLRAVAAVSWLALVARLLSTALPGSRSGIERWIVRGDFASGFLTQLSVLLGGALLMLLVMGTLTERDLPYPYRFVAALTSFVIVLLVMLAAMVALDPFYSLVLGVACLVLATAGASAAVRVPASRAQGLVISFLILGAASRLATRLLAIEAAGHDPTWPGHVAWLATAGSAFDALGIALAATRLRGEHRARAGVALVSALGLTCAVAWGAQRASLEHAPLWEVLSARGMDQLTASPIAFSTLASRTSIEALAVLLAGVVVLWPGRMSAGMVSIALALTARPGAEVPAAALTLALGALVAPLGAVRATADRSRELATEKAGASPRTEGADGRS